MLGRIIQHFKFIGTDNADNCLTTSIDLFQEPFTLVI